MKKELLIKKAAAAGMTVCMFGSMSCFLSGYMIPGLAANAAEEYSDFDVAEDVYKNNKKDKETLFGDVNGDGLVSAYDANMIINYINGNEPPSFDKNAADVNVDGTIDYYDAAIIFDMIAGNNLKGKLGAAYKKISKQLKNEIFEESAVIHNTKNIPGHNKNETFVLTPESANVELYCGSGFEIIYNLDFALDYEYIFMDIEREGIFKDAKVTYSFSDQNQTYTNPIQGDKFVLNVAELKKRYNNLYISFSGEVPQDTEIGALGELGLTNITAMDVEGDSIGVYCENSDRGCNAKVIDAGNVNVVHGDITGDGVVTLKDVVLIRRYIAGGWNIDIDMSNADVNGDGVVNLKDAVLLRRYIAGGWNVTL
jgi:hypothetical protein